MKETQDELILKYDLNSHIALLKAIQKPVEYKLVEPPRESFLEDAAQKIPFLAKFIPNADKVKNLSEIVIKVGDRISDANSPGNKGGITIFQAGEIALAALNVVTIPLMYLSYYMLYRKKDRVPVNFSNNAKFLYSLLGLGLAIVALTVSGAAPVIAVSMATIGLGLSAYVLGKTFSERFALRKEKKIVSKEILQQENNLDSIQLEAQQLEEALKSSQDEEQITALLNEVALVRERYDWQKNSINSLKNQELRLDRKIEALGLSQVIDKSVGLALSSFGVICVVVTLLIPPVGLWMMAGGAIAAGAYGVAKLVAPVVRALSTWFAGFSLKSSDKPPANDLNSSNDFSLDNALNPNKAPNLGKDSYSQVLSQCNNEPIKPSIIQEEPVLSSKSDSGKLLMKETLKEEPLKEETLSIESPQIGPHI